MDDLDLAKIEHPLNKCIKATLSLLKPFPTEVMPVCSKMLVQSNIFHKFVSITVKSAFVFFIKIIHLSIIGRP